MTSANVVIGTDASADRFAVEKGVSEKKRDGICSATCIHSPENIDVGRSFDGVLGKVNVARVLGKAKFKVRLKNQVACKEECRVFILT